MADIRLIRIELCKMNCRKHLRTPEITITNGILDYHTCCDDFKQRLELRYEELMNAEPVKVKQLR